MTTPNITKQAVGFLRQFLNENRITDPKKMVTNEDITHWLQPLFAYIAQLERGATAGEKLAQAIENEVQSDFPLFQLLGVALAAYRSAVQDSPKEIAG